MISKKRMLVFLLYFLVIHVHYTGFSQEHHTQKDSLSDYTVEEINTLFTKYKFSNPSLAKAYAETLLKRAEKENDQQKKYEAYSSLGEIETIKGEYTTAIVYYDQAISHIKNIGRADKVCEELLKKVSAYLDLGNQKEALKVYNEATALYADAYAIVQKENDLEYELFFTSSLAAIKSRLGKHEEAKEIFLRNLHLAKGKKFKNKYIHINLLLNVGVSYLDLNQLDSSLYYTKIGLKKSIIIDDVDGSSYFLLNMGIAHYKKKSYLEAIEVFQKAEKVIIGLKNETRLTFVHFYIGKCYKEMQAYDAAITSFRKVLDIAKKHTSIPSELKDTYKLLADCYTAKGSAEEATQFYQMYIQLNKEVYDDKEEAIELLHKDEVGDLEQEIIAKEKIKSQQQFYILILIGLIGIVLGVLFFLIRKHKKQKLLFKKIIDQQNSNKQKEIAAKPIITDEKIQAILVRLEKLEQQEYFLKQECNLKNLAAKAKTNSTYLTRILKEYKGKVFYDYINELRITYAIERLKTDKKFRSYTIKHIAKELGYKSSDSFLKHFKAQTKLYPSYFIKNLNKLPQQENS